MRGPCLANHTLVKILSKVFKISRFQIWGDKVILEMSAFEILVFEISSVEGKDKQLKFEVKVSVWL